MTAWQAQLKKDGVDDATIAKLAQADTIKNACDRYRAITQAQIANTVRRTGIA